MQSQVFNRRQIIKMLGFGTAFSNVVGKSWAAPLATEIKPLDVSNGGLLRVTLADFPALSQPFGSVRIGTSPMLPDGTKQTGLFAPILINRGSGSQLFVMSAECTHEGCSVPTYNENVGRMVCPCHGSQYDLDGTVRQGPAMQSLQQFEFDNVGGVLAISIPDLFFEITLKALPSGNNPVELSFIAFASIEYELYGWDKPDATGVVTPFSLTPDGPSIMSVVGNDEYVTMYVPRAQSGFYEVAMKTQPV
jgi:cytochrome b6-f complex iron-sulfur subunit